MGKKKHKKAGGTSDNAIPQALKDAGAALLAKADTPAGREAIASGLAMIATVAAARKAKHEAAKAEPVAEPPEKPAEKPGDPGIKAEMAPVVEALSAAATAFMAKLAERRR